MFSLKPSFPDLDREEAFTGGLPEFPSLDNGTTTNGDEDDEHSLGLSSLPPDQPISFKKTPGPPADQPADRALELVTQMAADVLTASVTAAIQERVEAAVALATTGSNVPESSRLLELADESDSEAEDFELLDQSELERLEGELGLGGGAAQVKGQADSSGFLSKLLRRH